MGVLKRDGAHQDRNAMSWFKSLFGQNQGKPQPAVVPKPSIEDQLTPEQRVTYESFKAHIATLQELLDSPISEQPREFVYANIQSARLVMSDIDAITEANPILKFKNKLEIEKILDKGEWYVQPLFQKELQGSTLVAIIDTETTGLEEHDQPISVGAVLLEVTSDKGDLIREVDSYYGLREPTVPINPQAQAVHGLGIECLRGTEFDMKRLYKIIDSAELLVAHNAKFDRRMLSHVMPRIVDAEWACTMYTLKFEWAMLTGGKWALDTICKALDVERPEPHNALIDCRALQSVLMVRSGKTDRSKRLMGKVISNAWAPAP